MITVKLVNSKKLMRDFVSFPLKLYKGNPYYCYPFYDDEMNLYDPKGKGIFSEYCDYAMWVAYRDGETVGRLMAIVNHAYIDKWQDKCGRFSRYDVIDDIEVSKALFDEAFKYFAAHGMETLHGPMGFHDIDREGLLVEGFDWPQTYGGSYNYPYYQTHLETLGFAKEVDWLERRVTLPNEVPAKVTKLASMMREKFGLTDVTESKLSMRQIIKRYVGEIFDLIDVCYSPLHGTVPLTQRTRQMIASQLTLILKKKYISIIADKDGKIIAFGVLYPAIWDAMNKCKGKVFPTGIFHLIPALNRKDIVEFGLIAVHPDWQRHAVTAIIMDKVLRALINDGVQQAETNANLEDNYNILNIWEHYDNIQHKRKRCYRMPLPKK